MNYKLYVYAFTVILASYALSGLNFDSFMKKNKPIEARILVVLLSIALGFLAGRFIIEFIEVSKIL